MFVNKISTEAEASVVTKNGHGLGGYGLFIYLDLFFSLFCSHSDPPGHESAVLASLDRTRVYEPPGRMSK